jgi:hypothetical protein
MQISGQGRHGEEYSCWTTLSQKLQWRRGGRGGGVYFLAGVSSVGVAGPKEFCDVTIFYNGKLKWLESCTLLNPFLFIKNRRLFLSSEGFSTLEKNAMICYQRAILGRAWQASADNKGPLMNKKGLTYQELIVTLAG